MDATKEDRNVPSPALTSNLEVLQVAVVLGAVEEEACLALGALDEAVGGQQLLHHARLPDAHPSAVGKGSVAIVMQQARVKAHLYKGNKTETEGIRGVRCSFTVEKGEGV